MNVFRTMLLGIPASLIGIGIGGLIVNASHLAHRIKAPVSRYHGYELNRAAIQKAKAFTVLISDESWGGIGRGTGVIYDARHVLTCDHMSHAYEGETDLPDEFWIFVDSGTRVLRGEKVFESRKDDLLILELNQPVMLDSATFAVFQNEYYVGEPITIIGNTLGRMTWFVSYGLISSEDGPYLITDGLSKPGNSGGPWINEKGEVLALTDWGLETNGRDEGISGGVSAAVINKFLNSYKQAVARKSLPTDIDILFGVINDGTAKIHGRK